MTVIRKEGDVAGGGAECGGSEKREDEGKLWPQYLAVLTGIINTFYAYTLMFLFLSYFTSSFCIITQLNCLMKKRLTCQANRCIYFPEINDLILYLSNCSHR